MQSISEKLETNKITVYFGEVLEEISRLKTRTDRIRLLQKFRDRSPENQKFVVQFMECLTHPRVVFDLPPGMPPIADNGIIDYDSAHISMAKVFQRVPYFVATTPSYVKNQAKREHIFVQTLESMYKKDAELFCMLKDKALDSKVYRGVTNQLLIDAFMPEHKEPLGN
ncbi:MAG: hypothetical protein KGI54_14895 [Pseudomonadota bacterium]|nr:hypothetical protein [Pseudomonadota bacterium]